VILLTCVGQIRLRYIMHALELDISRLDPKDRINPDDGQEAKSTTLAGSIVLEITKQRQLLCMSFGLPRAVLCWETSRWTTSAIESPVWLPLFAYMCVIKRMTLPDPVPADKLSDRWQMSVTAFLPLTLRPWLGFSAGPVPRYTFSA